MQQMFILILASTSAAIITFLLQKYGLSVVVASSLIGLFGALLGHLLKMPHLPLVVFAGSFVGMMSTSIGSIPIIVIGGAFAGFLYSTSLNVFPGFGGRLGTIGFISIVISFYLVQILEKINTAAK